MRVLVGRYGPAVRLLRPAGLRRLLEAARSGLPVTLAVSGADLRDPTVLPVFVSFADERLGPDLVAAVVRARAAGAVVEVVTDGRGLDNARARALLDAGLHRLRLRLDAAEPALYARLHDGGDLRRVQRFGLGLLAMRDALRSPTPAVEVHTVLSAANGGQVAPVIALCRELGVEPLFVGRGDADEVRRGRALATRHGLRRTAASLDALLSRSAACLAPWFGLAAGADGALYPCAEQARCGGERVGDTVAEAWTGPRMRAFRRRLREDRAADPICAACPREDAALAAFTPSTARRARMPGRTGGDGAGAR